MKNFFSQKINQWLCLALLGLMCFWTVLYYLGHKAYDFGNASNVDAAFLK
jgi:hypothetical protein